MQVRGAKLRELRRRRLLTLRGLAEQAGVDYTTINRLENGLQQARVGTIRKLAAALGVDPEELIDWGAEGTREGEVAA